ncbi:hypothetical protein G3N55_07715 [Dissulfurirhabdus thermomarina]|uniref:Tetratricopeptide repeat protein n=1 Tax=Dissulfurirhabdus thermomarina TaxID=1765737 RepID=A0A6N9TW63_DISTH|nr:hypothetical protein [Dissulfurirhabdus thermomarina]NDY42726.1 hypothetical protein [Dissulfurirhabdus thermomarina]NMX23638.1 hypothetical protein [Dissulfurirhabdus thermomarina]
MKGTRGTILVLALALFAVPWCTDRLYEARGRFHAATAGLFPPPTTGVLRASTLEFTGAASDWFFLRVMTVVGQALIEAREPSRAEWQWVYEWLDRVTDLDPRFWDPYVFAEAVLTWKNDMLPQADRLLLKAAEARPDLYRPYFYLGFNHFYFQRDYATAAGYLRKAAKRPGAPGWIMKLAARMSLYGGQTMAGIVLLDDLIRTTRDPRTRASLLRRRQALEAVAVIEKAVAAFRREKGRFPKDIEELVRSGLLASIPADPYGGRFYLDREGRVDTTSRFLPKRR